MTEEASQSAAKSEMPLLSHLLELRDRLLRSVIAILVVFLALFYWANDIYLLLSAPLRENLPENSTMIATNIISPFLTPFKMTAIISVFIAMPYILHQAWAFISPGLYRHEKRFAFPLLFSSIVLFYSGLAFAYFVVFPLAWPFLTGAGPAGVQVLPDISSYLSIVLKMFFAFGLAFEIPVATVLMIWSGLTTVESLREKRPYVIVGVFVVGMLLTPPDVISQILLAIPMWILFELGIIFAQISPNKKSGDVANKENNEQ
ncbi:twin-arginine translocase subunit TatC [Aliikangiella coralliicola]|uniref:Sec-independent protein translocase protein TatC n=1 Tax=Aliikangiella coralliicola TaxID=2592383 RepID=A0A545UHN3_9GAMM|nr:twin-arginine translocase subunit TatC [Aliikangiella coralliicola]TQV88972.1 twin-arginine translocase subunit TatC [Aliikangiella coralliicola]